MYLYEQLADQLRTRIDTGFYRPEDRLPSVRILASEYQVSLSTVQQAYHQLEDEYLIEARPKSGYFVCALRNRPRLPPMGRTTQRPVEVSQWDQVRQALTPGPLAQEVNLGSGTPNIEIPTLNPLLKALSQSGRQQGGRAMLDYDDLQGNAVVRAQVARMALHHGAQLHPDEMLMTTGCHEAIAIAMRAVCEPGGIIAVESPGFYGALQSIRAFGMKAMEIPTHPEHGISLEALELALEQWPIRAIQVTPTCNNPLGYSVSADNKKALYRLAQRFDIAIIEDDTYGDLSYAPTRQPTIKSFDEDGRVLLCSGFSKVLAPGLRLGWIAPGRYFERALHMKYVGTGSTAQQSQLAVARFIDDGHFMPHLRRMRSLYQQQRDRVLDQVQRDFPESIRVSDPQGGFLLWFECAPEIDCVQLSQQLAQEGVRFAPGSMFSPTGKYRHCLRISYANWHKPEQKALSRIGQAIQEMMDA